MARRNYVKVKGRSPAVPRAWRKRLVILALAAGGALFLWSVVIGEMGLVKYYRMRAQEQALRAEIGHLKQDNLRLIQEVRSLKHDPAYIERLARDKIGLARPGEVVYYYGDTHSR
jgi:cell division protein FtsB